MIMRERKKNNWNLYYGCVYISIGVITVCSFFFLDGQIDHIDYYLSIYISFVFLS